MGSSGGSNNTTTVQKADPWSGQQPYLLDIFSEAKKLYDSGGLSVDYYPGSTVAPQSGWTTQALQMQADRALGGSTSVQAAQGSVDGIVAGQGLAGNAGLGVLEGLASSDINAGNAGLAALESMSQSQNPYLSGLYQDASREALSVLDGSFSRAGRYGSGAHAAAQADAVAGLASEMYGAAYEQQLQAAAQAANAYNAGLGQQINAAQAAGQLYGTGVNQQLSAASLAQGLANQGYVDAAALAEAGAAQESYQQALINADVERWNTEQLGPISALNLYNQLVQGNYGSTVSTSTQNGGGNKLGGVISGVGAGASLGATVGGPLGALIGGLGGGILSFL